MVGAPGEYGVAWDNVWDKMAAHGLPYDEVVAESPGIREVCNKDGSPAYFRGAVVREGALRLASLARTGALPRRSP